MTDPDWEPVMKRAAAIVTNRGGRTCHAAIIARELGIPAVVGCGDATSVLKEQQVVTVSCADGDTGHVYEGLLDVDIVDVAMDKMPAAPTKIMMNVGNPELAFEFCRLPNEGVGLARLEFIINRNVGVHPKALINFDTLPADLKQDVARRIGGYPGPTEFYVVQDRGRRGDYCSRILAEKSHRPLVRFQVERILQPGRRFSLRAA